MSRPSSSLRLTWLWPLGSRPGLRLPRSPLALLRLLVTHAPPLVLFRLLVGAPKHPKTHTCRKAKEACQQMAEDGDGYAR